MVAQPHARERARAGVQSGLSCRLLYVSCPCTCHTGNERLEDALRTTLVEAEMTRGTRAASTDASAGAWRVGTLRGLLPCLLSACKCSPWRHLTTPPSSPQVRELLPCPLSGERCECGESRPGDEPGRWDRERALKSRGDEGP